ncbi:acetylxylan esterase [Dyadobacter sp. CY261]|uniref:glucuronyl esterase domain-containing protein n=1 Tax=Dyadobacter sp. CY261 TaxID=2907203 RepID=UPI001F1CE55D|nr:acetylxylan esterase [Dyadobacter sp. CY261]MCF0074162.1 acetylxylan esterase [Dyadobacter sp. CY261]
MMKFLTCLLMTGCVAFSASAQFGLTPAQRDSLNKLTAADHADMLQQLGITAGQLRKGPSGNPKDPNAANSSEAKVNQYNLPDPLTFKNGQKVKNAREWTEKRRPEIAADFETEIYGKLPAQIPAVNWQIVSDKDTLVGNQAIRQKILKGIVDNAAFPSMKVEISLLLTTPASAPAVPVVLEFGFIRSPFNPGPIKPIGLGSAAEPTWQEQLISRGWGYAIIEPASIQADNGAGLTAGIIGLVNKGRRRKPTDWGALRAWAWGASRAIDYFEKDKNVDAKRIAIEGLSRYGKAAIVAMAFEPRISLGFIGSSGAGGAKILRRIFGEQVENLASSGEYHWFSGKFIQYASKNTPDDLPVDAHELIALCAPRPVFISAGSPQVEGHWIDARGMFEAAAHADAVYKLFGKKDLGTMQFPKLGTPLVDGEIAFRQHAGGHSTGPNWSTWIAWACRYWGDCKYD